MKGDLKPVICQSCGEAINKLEPDLRVTIESYNHPDVPAQICPICQKTIGIFVQDKFLSLQELLKCEDSHSNGWFKVESDSDWRALFTLGQIIYREFDPPNEGDGEVEFAYPSAKDVCKILKVGGECVGFYTAKPKGSLDLESLYTYSMLVLDSIFIRSSHRRQGLARSVLSDLLADLPPTSDFGFSYPISASMKKVILKHLEASPGDRIRFWEYSGEGNCRNLWMTLYKTSRSNRAIQI